MRKSDAPPSSPKSGNSGPAACPGLSGTGRIGEALRVRPGVAEASRPAFQWRRDGVDIPGAVGAFYVPGPDDDLRLVSCRVTVGTGTAVTPARRVTRPPPAGSGTLREEGLGTAGADWSVGIAEMFSGGDLLYSVAGGGARIDPREGRLTLETGRARAGEIVTVRAENSGGSAETAFIVTVEAAREPAPARPSSGIFVDAGAGRDAGAGTPEDPLRAVPASLGPGARVFLRRGSTCRDPIVIASGGRAEAPAVLDFETWGDRSAPPALVDLSEPLAGIGPGAPVGGAAVLAAEFPASVPRARWPDTLMVQQDGRLMGLAQLPTPANFARTSDLAEWFDYDVYENAGSRETGWREWITAPAAFAEISGPKEGLLLRVWGWGNRTAVYQVADHDPATGRAEIVPYLHERPVVPREDTQPVKRKLAIINHPDCLRVEGQYLIDPAVSKLILRPFDGAAPGTARFAAAAGGGASGIEIRAPHVTLVGARVRMVASAEPLSAGVLARSGEGGVPDGLILRRCHVEDCVVAGAGIHLHGGRGVIARPLVEDCHVRNMLGASCRGVFLNGVEDGMVRACSADVTSSTGISLYGCSGTRVFGNVSGRPAGVHGNGFSFYQGCRDLLIAFNTVFQPGHGGMAMTMQSAGNCAIVFNDFVMGDGNTVAFYGPKRDHAELGGHVFANNNVLNVTEGKALRIATIPLWNDVPGERIRKGEERRDPDDPERRAWVSAEATRVPEGPGRSFARERAANPGRWTLYGATGMGPDWPAGRPFLGMVLVNNVVDGILSREIAEPNSYAMRTANLNVSGHSASTSLARAEALAIGEQWQEGAKRAIFRDWRGGDLSPEPRAWTGLLEGRGAVWSIRGVRIDWIGRWRLAGGVATDAWDWRNEPL